MVKSLHILSMKGKNQAYFSLAKKASFREKDEVFSLLLGKGALQVVAQVNEGALPRPLTRQDEEILVEPGDDPEIGVLEHLDKRFTLTKQKCHVQIVYGAFHG
jgi:hypothetical protein